MHVHMRPFPVQQGTAAPTPRSMRPPPTSGSDVHALAALSKDRNGSGSRQRHQQRNAPPEQDASARVSPAASLAALLAKLDMDALG